MTVRAFAVATALLSTIAVIELRAQDASESNTKSGKTATASETERTRRQLVDQGIEYLTRNGQSDDGTFSRRVGPGVTALAVTSALRNGRTVNDPMVRKAL